MRNLWLFGGGSLLSAAAVHLALPCGVLGDVDDPELILRLRVNW
ncbi:hypothetical protein [Actinomadura sp. KC06]|nr:hypothetical protein [Actinomadura sp. KC06]